ncbi:MAG: hypothetical protein LBK73_04290 [Treponema sp.]|nr:hypothetical protein [Treponema sp.]
MDKPDRGLFISRFVRNGNIIFAGLPYKLVIWRDGKGDHYDDGNGSV